MQKEHEVDAMERAGRGRQGRVGSPGTEKTRTKGNGRERLLRPREL